MKLKDNKFIMNKNANLHYQSQKKEIETLQHFQIRKPRGSKSSYQWTNKSSLKKILKLGPQGNSD